MIDSGVHAIMIKTAAMGLEPRKHLGQTISDLYNHLCHIVSHFKFISI